MILPRGREGGPWRVISRLVMDKLIKESHWASKPGFPSNSGTNLVRSAVHDAAGGTGCQNVRAF